MLFVKLFMVGETQKPMSEKQSEANLAFFFSSESFMLAHPFKAYKKQHTQSHFISYLL